MNALLYATVVLIWGTTWIALKWQLGVVPIGQSIAYRFALAALVSTAWLLWRRQVQLPRRKDAPLVLAQGLCLFCLNFVCFLKASANISSGLVAVVFSSATLWNALLTRLFDHRPLAPQVLAGGAMGLGGLALLFWPELTSAGPSQAKTVGLLWALAGTWCFSCGNLLSAALQARGLTPMQSNPWAMFAGAAILLLTNAALGVPLTWDASWRYGGALLYLAIPGSVIGFTAYLTLVGRLGAARAAYATVLFPVVALNVSALLEGYRWTAAALAGLALVVTGNVLVFRKK